MSALAVNPLAAVLVCGVGGGQEDRAIRQQAPDDPAGRELCQPPARPASLREDAAVAGGVAGDERSQRAQEVGDGAAADGEESGGQQQAEARGGSAAEGAPERVEQGAGRAGQLVAPAVQLAADGACLAGLPAPPLASLGLGQLWPRAYAGHHSLLVRGTGCVLFP